MSISWSTADERRAAIGPPPHGLEREVTLDVHQLADERQEILVALARALEEHLVRGANAQVARFGQVEQLGGLARRGREGFLDVDAGAVRQAQLREFEMRVRRRDDVHHVGTRARQQLAGVRESFDVGAEARLDFLAR